MLCSVPCADSSAVVPDVLMCVSSMRLSRFSGMRLDKFLRLLGAARDVEICQQLALDHLPAVRHLARLALQRLQRLGVVRNSVNLSDSRLCA